MKASQIAVIVAILAVLASLVVSTFALAAPDELLLNPGFEDGVAGWAHCSGVFSDVDSHVHSGDYAAILIVNTAESWIYQVVPVQPNGTYTFSGWAIKNDDDVAAVSLRIGWYERDDGYGDAICYIDNPFEQLMDNHPDYKPLIVTGDAPPNAHSAEVECVAKLVDAPNGLGIAYFDDMSFTGPPPTTPTPTPTLTPTPSLTPTPTTSPTPIPTSTPVPTATPTPMATSAFTPTPTTSPTPTSTPTLTSTPTPTPSGTTAERGDVLINEVQYNPTQSGPDADFEWVEIYNPTDDDIDLGGWTITDNHESDSIPSLVIPAECFAVVAATEGIYTNYPELNCTLVFLQDGCIGNGLNNEGDCLILADALGNVIDAFSYGSDSSQSLHHSGVDEGHSLERSPPGGEFVDNQAPTPCQGLFVVPTPTPSATSTLMPTPTPTPTPAPMVTSTPVPTLLSSPTPQPSNGGTSFSSTVLRAVIIVIAIACLGIGLWLRRRSRK
jgi:hypothetical protein